MMINLPNMTDNRYWGAVKTWAIPNSDGCTGVHDFYVQACWEHDFHYRFATTLYGDPITFDESNLRFRQVMQMLSRLKWFSPLSWIRYLGVREFGKHIWDNHRVKNLPPPVTIAR